MGTKRYGRGVIPNTETRMLDKADAILTEPAFPAIYYIETPNEKPVVEFAARAAAMGFNFLGLKLDLFDLDSVKEAGDIAESFGLSLILDLDIEWFMRGRESTALHYASACDSLVDWWDKCINNLQAAKVKGFRCLEAFEILAGVWQRLISAAKSRDKTLVFAASTAGATPDAITNLACSGFDYSFSSSYWWDFQAAWINGDARRIAKIGPSISLAAPLRDSAYDIAIERERVLYFAATYSPGWLLQAGFEYGKNYDVTGTVAALNELRQKHPALKSPYSARLISSAGAPVAVLVRECKTDRLVLAVNTSANASASIRMATILPLLGPVELELIATKDEARLQAGDLLKLASGEFKIYQTLSGKPIKAAETAPPTVNAPRIAIESITPKVDNGQFPVRRIVGEIFHVEADIISDGHDKLAAELLWRPLDETKWHNKPMQPLANDRWQANFPLQRLGRYQYTIAAWRDIYASFADELEKKCDAGLDVSLEIQEGLKLISEASALTKHKKIAKFLDTSLLKLKIASETDQRTALLSDEIAAAMRIADPKKFLIQSETLIIDAERLAARFGSWYEIFPRSQSGEPDRHGTFKDVIAQLPRIAAMGFDVLYFPPIHPIGRKNRKGRNNTLTPAPDDPGSPYAIGAVEGGHDAIHPELGSLADFQELRLAAGEQGLELALDFAIQCAPDHPWLKEHPEWFDWRLDGSLRYAENPPKKYEDIVNVDFYAPGSMPSLWLALRDVVQFWIDQGIRLFRVDNPHTKPLPFWEWMIADIRSRHPDTIFLAEAFTRPKLMYRLAKIGFSQSYTYFTWRHTKQEFQDYITELTTTAPKDFFRPHFFVNTPDINPNFLQNSGRAGFLIRAALAATLSGLWGVYNGFELCEATPVPNKEEYLDSEKYQIKTWDHDRPGNIISEITKLNLIRRNNAALHSHLNIEFHNVNSGNILFFSKSAVDGNTLLIAIALDPAFAEQVQIELPFNKFGLEDNCALNAEDLMHNFKFTWHGRYQSVMLHPGNPFCIWRIEPAVSAAL